MTQRDWNTARLAFVCSGNICRSPMAAGLAQHLFDARGFFPMIISMGTLGMVGKPASPEAIEAMQAIGVEISGHRSQGLNKMLLEAADHVFVMEPQHRPTVAQIATSSRILLLSDYGEGLDEIPDPVGQSLQYFIEVRDMMKTCLENWMAQTVDAA